MKHDFELLLIVILVGIIAIIAILGGSYDLLIEKKERVRQNFMGQLLCYFLAFHR